MTRNVEIPVIKTAHYLLRGVVVEDASSLFPFLSDKTTMKFITPHPVQSVDAIRDSIIEDLEKYNQEKVIPWVIVQRETGDVVGTFKFHKLNAWHRKAEMGVVIRKEYQHQGVMTEILEKVLQFGFDTLNLNRIVGDIFAGNEGSRKLLQKFGFNKEGQLRQTDFDGEHFHDTVVYSLLKAEYESRGASHRKN